ncbi:MAG: hypothetical protein WBJ75_14745 [Pseudohongiellaceae bacterium]
MPQPEAVLVTANVQRLAELVGTSPVVDSADSRRASVRLESGPSVAITPPAPREAIASATAASIAAPAGVASTSAPAPIPSKVMEDDTRFAFAYFPVNEELAVINELPWAKSAAVSPACRQLLAAILKALSVPCDEKSLTSMVFTWPLAEGPDFDRSAQSARHTLDGFLARRFKLRPVRYLLILAEQSAEFLFPAQFDWRQDGMKRHPLHAVDVIVTRSLNAMDAVPDIKRSVWQALQPLRAALAQSASDASGSERPDSLGSGH